VDEELARLKRRVEEAPDDVEAAGRYAAALERAGRGWFAETLAPGLGLGREMPVYTWGAERRELVYLSGAFRTETREALRQRLSRALGKDASLADTMPLGIALFLLEELESLDASRRNSRAIKYGDGDDDDEYDSDANGPVLEAVATKVRFIEENVARLAGGTLRHPSFEEWRARQARERERAVLPRRALTLSATFARGSPVREAVPSPDGQHLALVFGDGRPWTSATVTGAALFRRQGARFEPVGRLPVAAENVLVLDGGVCVVAIVSTSEVVLVRCRPIGGAVVEDARWSVAGGSLSFEGCVLLAPGQEALVGAVDRDDGQGWSDPVYTSLWSRVNLVTGARVDGAGPEIAGRAHTLLAPAAPWASPFDGGSARLLEACVQALPFRRERARRVGPRRLLTTARVIDVATGRTLLGERNEDFHPERMFHDMTGDERLVAASGKQGVFELRDVETGECSSLSPGAGVEVRCAAFLPRGEIVVGTSDGAALVRWE
jgi:hypothetical protein